MARTLYIINKDKKGIRKLRPSIQKDEKLSGAGRKVVLANQKTVNKYKDNYSKPAPAPAKSKKRKRKSTAWTRHKRTRYYNVHP